MHRATCALSINFHYSTLSRLFGDLIVARTLPRGFAGKFGVHGLMVAINGSGILPARRRKWSITGRKNLLDFIYWRGSIRTASCLKR